MNEDNFEKLIDEFVPNYRRFQDALDPDGDVMIDITLMLRKVYDAWILESIWKHINLELGMCVLKNKEINQDKLREMLRTFRK